MGPILRVNAKLVALQYLFCPVEICHSVYLRSTFIQGQPHEGAELGGLSHFWIWDFLKLILLSWFYTFVTFNLCTLLVEWKKNKKNMRLPTFNFCEIFKRAFIGYGMVWHIATSKPTNRDGQTDRQTYTHILQCSFTSVGLAGTCSNHYFVCILLTCHPEKVVCTIPHIIPKVLTIVWEWDYMCIWIRKWHSKGLFRSCIISCSPTHRHLLHARLATWSPCTKFS